MHLTRRAKNYSRVTFDGRDYPKLVLRSPEGKWNNNQSGLGYAT